MAARLSSGAGGRTVLKTGSGLYWQSPQGEVLLLHDARYGFLPFGLGIENSGRLLSGMHAPPGSPVSIRGGILTVGSEQRDLNLTGMKVQRAAVIGRPKRPAREDIDALISYGARRGSSGGFQELLWHTGEICGRKDAARPRIEPGLFVRKAIPALTGLVRALRAADAAGIRHGLGRISGLGPGLTPSGDDVLLGMTAAYVTALQAGIPVPPGAALLPELILGLYAADRPGIGGVYVCSAARREHFSLLDDVLARILDADAAHGREECLDKLLGIGSSSGTDMLAGMIVALDTIADGDSH